MAAEASFTLSSVQISRLFKYPLKSARGLEHQELTLGESGPIGDRCWMLVDSFNRFLTQRTFPRMALIEVSEETDSIKCNAPEMPPLSVSIPKPTTVANSCDTRAIIWRDVVDVRQASVEAAEWFSTFLGHPCRLVYQPTDSIRFVDPEYSGAGDRVSLADGFPLLVIGQRSLDLLNEKLHLPITMERFRPNLVFDGGEPHDEDHWRRIRVGEIELQLVKPCARCAIPTVDPMTAFVGHEPTSTLAKYRRVGKKILFGQNAIARARGKVKVGDEVVVLEPVPFSLLPNYS